MRIRAAVLESAGQPFVVQELELAPPKTGEVRVKVLAAGVCHSDWHVASGATKHPMPCVAGHEGAGIVEEVGGAVETLRVGDLVALSWAPNCGSCFYCLRGRPALCATYVTPIWNGTMIDGTTRLSRDGKPIYHYSALACFAEQCVVPEGCCVKLPGDTPPMVAALLGCAVTTGVGAALYSAQVRPGEAVVVMGAGGVGLSAVMGANLAGASLVVAVDPFPDRRSKALAVGATHAFEPSEDSFCALQELTDGRGADVVIEAVGAPRVQESALEWIRPGGRLVLAGLSPMGSVTNFPSAELVRQEKSVVGSYYGSCHPQRDFVQFARWAASGRLPVASLIDRTFALEAINEAYEALLGGNGARSVLLPNGPLES